MKKTLLLLILLTGVFYTSNAQLLWKITGKGLTKPSWIFASYHYTPIKYLDSIPGIYNAFESSEQMVCEIALNQVDAIMQLENAALMPNHTRMGDLLKNERYTTVDTILRSSIKLGLKALDRMNPTLILSLYSMELFKKQTHQTDDMQSDSYFQLVADEKGKKVIGLESAEEVIRIMYGNIPLQRQADILYEKLTHKEMLISQLLRMNSLYRAGKLDILNVMSRGNGESWDPTENELNLHFENRHEQWMKEIPALLENHSCFIQIGAEHVGGKNGILHMLEKEGYHISAVKY